MDKNNRKITKYDALRALLYKELAEKHSCSVEFVRKAVTGDRTSLTALNIRKEYYDLREKTESVITTATNQ